LPATGKEALEEEAIQNQPSGRAKRRGVPGGESQLKREKRSERNPKTREQEKNSRELQNAETKVDKKTAHRGRERDEKRAGGEQQLKRSQKATSTRGTEGNKGKEKKNDKN